MKQFRCERPSHYPPRRGAVILFALIALLVASLLIAALMQTAAMSHREMKRDEIRMQANRLADAGCRRALEWLRRKPDITGETWTVPANQLERGYTATVDLKIDSAADASKQRLVSIVVHYPVGNQETVKVVRTFPVP